ncbi:hypothetical protein B0A55_06188 [Friedmanniomyces simplex]|uniref:Methyltransferase domain-containing protein n=1 Tax=Friedmanniomyces simplex TaxID=329884 RepID=A0A4V5NFT2_9PEZI|nr:hypothetical protein B0A55_06188 [Friedmanniomyces simplex]
MAAQAPRNQPQDAQNLYDSRASNYDNSWHHRFARHMVELAELRPGEHVLDLACGTGLVTYPASTAVGPTGNVVGIDISSGMLARAKAKRAAHESRNVAFYQHSITDLPALPELEGMVFDVIICASALVLLDDPSEALRLWTTYLKFGGRLITHSPHPASQISLIIFGRVGQVLGRPVPFYRVPFQTPEDLRVMVEEAGLSSVEVVLMSQKNIAGTDALEAYRGDPKHLRIENTYSIADAD